MPSPFPGMDPYLEDPALWPDFHDALAGEIRALLNRNLPEPYYAQLGVREEIDIIVEYQHIYGVISHLPVHHLDQGQDLAERACARSKPTVQILRVQL